MNADYGNFTFTPPPLLHVNVTGLELYANFVNIINATVWANLQPQNFHEQVEMILIQPETIIMLILCFFALVVNVLSIMATCHIPHGLTTHSKLIISLAVSDILVMMSVLLHVVNKLVNSPMIPPSLTPEDRLMSACMFQFVNCVNIMAHLISLLNLFAMALDHYVAILKPLHYIHIMNRFRGNLMIGILWILALVGGFSSFLTGLSKSENDRYLNYCEYTLYSDFQTEYLIIGTALLCLISILYIYLRIYAEVKYMNNNSVLQKDELHNKKALKTTLLIIGTFMVCWLPSVAFQIGMIIQIHADVESVKKIFSALLKANKYLYALLLLNSLCDPIIYAVRLKEVQKGYFRLLSHCSKFHRNSLQRDKYKQSAADRKKSGTVTLPHNESDLPMLNGEAEIVPLTDIEMDHSISTTRNGISEC